jgi:DNA-binding NarL/FixJ family response regulator
LTACRAHRPELVLLGETLDPDHETLTLVERIKAISPHTRLLLVGMHPRGLYIRDAIAVGVQGYLSLLDDLREGLLTAVEFALRNRQYLSPSANAEYLTVLHQGQRKWQLDAEARTVLNLLVQGYSVADIAARMSSTVRHIYWVRDKLRNRFGATTNEHLVSRAKAEGFCAEVE